jgi:RNA polymerase sigma factor (TIGR02999 family)
MSSSKPLFDAKSALSNVAFQDLVKRWQNGDREASSALIAHVYPALRAIAASHVNRFPGQLTLSPTELAHEAYLRISDLTQINWESKAHCMAFVATLVRHVVVDYLRERSADKRSGGKIIVQLSVEFEQQLATESDYFSWLKINDTLMQLQSTDPECAKVVELKLFSDLTTDEIAEVCQSSVATVGRQWRFAKAWLSSALSDE